MIRAVPRITRVGLQVSLLLATILPACAQPLDWAHDVTVFGSPQSEHHPALVIIPGAGTVRALCLCDTADVLSKVSQDAGQSWSAVARFVSAVGQPCVVAASDDEFAYVLVHSPESGVKRLFRFLGSQNDWLAAHRTMIAPARTAPVMAAAITSDYAFQPDDPYINVCWTERDSASGQVSGWFAQSRDSGLTFRTERQVFTYFASAENDAELAVSASWEGDHERLIVAAPVDRPGSVPEQVRVFLSEDQGETWAAGIGPDSSISSQGECALAAFGNWVLLAYARSQVADSPRDVCFAFSPDGGSSFASPFAVAGSSADEHGVQLCVDAAGSSFHLFYLSGAWQSDSASVLVQSGSLASPWELGPPVLISEPDGALSSGGLAAAAGPQGVAVMWSARFLLGDSDVRFDASWRGSGLRPRFSPHADRFHLGHVYPNPFNGVAVLPMTLRNGGNVRVVVTDLLGRQVKSAFNGSLAPGEHRITLNLADLSSGEYFIVAYGGDAAVRRAVLIR